MLNLLFSFSLFFCLSVLLFFALFNLDNFPFGEAEKSRKNDIL